MDFQESTAIGLFPNLIESQRVTLQPCHRAIAVPSRVYLALALLNESRREKIFIQG